MITIQLITKTIYKIIKEKHRNIGSIKTFWVGLFL
jgi:hypothetical protein